jgi:hydrogenase maturation protease
LKQSSKQMLILGLGNRLSGDDGFGVLVLERLQKDRPERLAGASLVDAHTDLLNHIEDFPKYDCVVLVDAVLDSEKKLGEPGAVVMLDEDALQSFSEESHGAHQMSPLLAIKLFRTLHPESATQIFLMGLLVDQITHDARYATAEKIAEAAAGIRQAFL